MILALTIACVTLAGLGIAASIAILGRVAEGDAKKTTTPTPMMIPSWILVLSAFTVVYREIGGPSLFPFMPLTVRASVPVGVVDVLSIGIAMTCGLVAVHKIVEQLDTQRSTPRGSVAMGAVALAQPAVRTPESESSSVDGSIFTQERSPRA